MFDDPDRLISRSPDEFRRSGIEVHTRSDVALLERSGQVMGTLAWRRTCRMPPKEWGPRGALDSGGGDPPRWPPAGRARFGGQLAADHVVPSTGVRAASELAAVGGARARRHRRGGADDHGGPSSIRSPVQQLASRCRQLLAPGLLSIVRCTQQVDPPTGTHRLPRLAARLANAGSTGPVVRSHERHKAAAPAGPGA